MDKRELSIILCFYNAEEKLSDSIKYLKKLDTKGIRGVEIIFVDNNSNDNSCKIINTLLKDFIKFPWRIVKEPKSGLGNARLKGLYESKYDILLFCDDDNWLSEDYLSIGLNVLQNNSKIAVLGGKGTAISDIDLPNWFEENQTFYAVGEQKVISCRLKGEILIVYGAGMFIRKEAFLDIIKKGFYYFNFGRTGKKLTSGEDTEMCLAFLIGGYDICYEPNLKFFHFIESNRLTMKHLERLKEGIARSRFLGRFYLEYLNGYIPTVGKFFWVKEFFYSLKDLLLSLFQKNNKAEILRNFYFSLYLLQQRTRYNSNVSNLISICKSLDNN